MGRWGQEDDEKLKALFLSKKLDPKETDAPGCHKAHKCWPQIVFNSLCGTHKRKCSAWNLEQDLAGKRKGGKRGELLTQQ